MADKQAPDAKDSWTKIIGAVQTPLGFFVLSSLIGLALIGVASRMDGFDSTLLIVAGVAVLLLSILTVALLACFRPDFLYGNTAYRESIKFSKRVEGYWWSIQSIGQTNRIGWVRISTVSGYPYLKINGKSFYESGKEWAAWESTTACIDPTHEKVFYYWKGYHFSNRNDRYEGCAELTFTDKNQGDGVIYDDRALSKMADVQRRLPVFSRSTKEQVKAMESTDDKIRRETIIARAKTVKTDSERTH
jgi:hypothetical protein